MKPLKGIESNRIDPNLVDEIFYTIPEILEHHEKFLNALQDRISTDWGTNQVVGNVFIEAVSRERSLREAAHCSKQVLQHNYHPSNAQFTNQQIINTYTAFINNWKNARHAIKIATQAKPAFERFLEVRYSSLPVLHQSTRRNIVVITKHKSLKYRLCPESIGTN